VATAAVAAPADLPVGCQAASVPAGLVPEVRFPLLVAAAGCELAGGAGKPGTLGVAVIGGAVRL